MADHASSPVTALQVESVDGAAPVHNKNAPLFDDPSIAILAAPFALVAVAALSPTLHSGAVDNSSAAAQQWDGSAQYVTAADEFAVLPVRGAYLLNLLAMIYIGLTWTEVARRCKVSQCA